MTKNAKKMSEDQESFAPKVEDIEKCTRGLVAKFESPVQGIDVSKV